MLAQGVSKARSWQSPVRGRPGEGQRGNHTLGTSTQCRHRLELSVGSHVDVCSSNTPARGPCPGAVLSSGWAWVLCVHVSPWCSGVSRQGELILLPSGWLLAWPGGPAEPIGLRHPSRAPGAPGQVLSPHRYLGGCGHHCRPPPPHLRDFPNSRL